MVGAEASKHVLGGNVGARIGQGGADFLAHHLVDRGFLAVERTHGSANDLARGIVEAGGKTPVDTALLLAKGDSDGLARAHGISFLATPCSTEHDTVILKTLTPRVLANSAQPKAPADRRCRCGEHRRISSVTRRRRGPIRYTAGSRVAS